MITVDLVLDGGELGLEGAGVEDHEPVLVRRSDRGDDRTVVPQRPTDVSHSHHAVDGVPAALEAHARRMLPELLGLLREKHARGPGHREEHVGLGLVAVDQDLVERHEPALQGEGEIDPRRCQQADLVREAADEALERDGHGGDARCSRDVTRVTLTADDGPHADDREEVRELHPTEGARGELGHPIGGRLGARGAEAEGDLGLVRGAEELDVDQIFAVEEPLTGHEDCLEVAHVGDEVRHHAVTLRLESSHPAEVDGLFLLVHVSLLPMNAF